MIRLTLRKWRTRDVRQLLILPCEVAYWLGFAERNGWAIELEYVGE